LVLIWDIRVLQKKKPLTAKMDVSAICTRRAYFSSDFDVGVFGFFFQ
jgi:hypothetical protein